MNKLDSDYNKPYCFQLFFFHTVIVITSIIYSLLVRYAVAAFKITCPKPKTNYMDKAIGKYCCQLISFCLGRFDRSVHKAYYKTGLIHHGFLFRG